MKKEYVFLLWWGDAEMSRIKQFLQTQQYTYIDKWLSWWAKVEDYAAEISAIFAQGKQPVAIELTWAGEGEWESVIAIDHHGARAHEPASLMQVKALIDDFDALIIANDVGYIPAMQKELEKRGIMGDEQKWPIAAIRLQDRQAQHITPAQESEAEEAIRGREDLLDWLLTVMHLPHNKCATVTDRIYGTYQNLLIISLDGEVNFFGNGALCSELMLLYPGSWSGWSGLGKPWENAYWWGNVDAQAIRIFVTKALQK